MNAWKSIVACVLLTVAAAAGAKDESRLIFQADYENRDTMSGVSGMHPTTGSAKDSLGVDCQLARSGRCSLVSRVGMTNEYLTGDSHRSEVSTSEIPGVLYSAGERYRYRFSLYIDDKWQIDSRNSIDSFWQFKRTAGPPDMFLTIKGDSIVWRVGNQKQIVVFDKLPVGGWIDFMFDITWSTGADGRVALTAVDTKNNRSVNLRNDGPNMRDGRARSGYLKWGIYKPGRADRKDVFPVRTLHHDDIAVYRLQ